MSAGQPLFQTDVSPWKQHAFCLTLRTDEGELLFPPGRLARVDLSFGGIYGERVTSALTAVPVLVPATGGF